MKLKRSTDINNNKKSLLKNKKQIDSDKKSFLTKPKKSLFKKPKQLLVEEKKPSRFASFLQKNKSANKDNIKSDHDKKSSLRKIKSPAMEPPKKTFLKKDKPVDNKQTSARKETMANADNKKSNVLKKPFLRKEKTVNKSQTLTKTEPVTNTDNKKSLVLKKAFSRKEKPVDNNQESSKNEQVIAADNNKNNLEKPKSLLNQQAKKQAITKVKNQNIFSNINNYFKESSIYKQMLIALLTLVLMFAVSCIILAAFSKNPITYYADVFRGSLSSRATFFDTLGMAGILILVSLAFAIPSKARLFNIGISGQMMFAGAFTYLLVQIIFAKWNYGYSYSSQLFTHPLLATTPMHHAVELIFIIFISIVLGVIWSIIPGILKAYFNANEVVSTIMFNWIALALYSWIVTDSKLGFYNSTSGTTQSLSPNATFRFHDLSHWIYGTDALIGFFSIGVFVAIFLCFVVKFYLDKTKSGYGIRICNNGEKATIFAGFSYKWQQVKVMIISGIFSGLAASFYYFGIVNNMANMVIPIEFGFIAIAVSLIAKDNPIGIIFASLLFGTITIGRNYSASGNSNVSDYFADVIFSTLIFTTIISAVIIDQFMKYLKKRRINLKYEEEHTVKAMAAPLNKVAMKPTSHNKKQLKNKTMKAKS